jgi:hypothetical protein
MPVWMAELIFNSLQIVQNGPGHGSTSLGRLPVTLCIRLPGPKCIPRRRCFNMSLLSKRVPGHYRPVILFNTMQWKIERRFEPASACQLLHWMISVDCLSVCAEICLSMVLDGNPAEIRSSEAISACFPHCPSSSLTTVRPPLSTCSAAE